MVTQQPILLVEDDPLDVELMLRTFRKSCMHNPIVVARDGTEALDLLFGREGESPVLPVLPVLLLLDLNLPGISGLDVLKRVRAHERTRLLPVIVITASNAEGDWIDSLELGANRYVQKPVNFETFAEAAQRLSLYWVVRSEIRMLRGLPT